MKRFSSLFLAVLGVAGALSWAILGKAQEKAGAERSGSVVELIEGYETDRDELDRFYGHRVLSQSHMERLEKFYDETTGSLKAIDFEKLPQAERVDYLLMRHRLEYRKSSLATNQRKLAEIEKLTGFKRDVLALYEEYRQRGPMEPRAMAEKLVQIKNAVSTLEDKVSLKAGEGKLVTTAVLALRTQKVVGELQRRLEAWYKFYAGFDPQFSWWVKQPYGDLKNELESYRKKLGELATGGEEGEEAPLVGDPIGAAALADDLAMEMLSYSPEDLLAIGEREFAWCRAEMEKAAAEMGLGKDWRKALQRVKEDFVPPGKQDDLSAEIAKEAMAFLEKRNLVTVPDLCAETWYLKMLGKREQETLPYAVYFGQAIGIAYPTDEMSLEKKLMSLRGNNRHFTRAVIPHELIPGHHSKLLVVDAQGKKLPATMEPTDVGFSLAYHDAQAIYPVTVDPLISYQEQKLNRPAPSASGNFGVSVAISGDSAIIGASRNNDSGNNSGSAYIFTRSGSAWTLQAKLTADDAAAGDNFGGSVAISGDLVIIGAEQGDHGGAAFIFNRSCSTWSQQAKLNADDPLIANDNFGVSVAIFGDSVVIGVDGDDDGGSSSGSAYIFTRTGSVWSQQAKLTADDATVDGSFGGSVAISSDSVIIGAEGDDDGGSNSGSSYIFTRSGSTWSQQAKLHAGDPSANDYFGSAVAISGDSVVIGAHRDDDGGSESGSAYIFTRAGSTW
jgi:hypothetical protein